MRFNSKCSVLVLITLLATSSVIIFGTASCQSMPKPSVPEFTVKQVDRSYDVPIQYYTTTDPFTGKQETHSSGGYRVANMTIDVIIKNQPFTPVTLENSTVIQICYSVRCKGHFSEWDNAYQLGDGSAREVQANGGYTVITFLVNPQNNNGQAFLELRSGQEDFQVKAHVGYFYQAYHGLVPMGQALESLSDSGWSPTQTITYGSNVEIRTPSPTNQQFTSTPTASTPQLENVTETPFQPDTQTGISLGVDVWQIAAIALAVLVVVLLVVIGVLLRRRCV